MRLAGRKLTRLGRIEDVKGTTIVGFRIAGSSRIRGNSRCGGADHPRAVPASRRVLISGSVQSSFGTTSYQQLVAKVGVAVVGLYPGWSGGGFTANSAAAAVKALNPNIKLFPYTNIMELEPGVSSSGSAYSPVYSAVSSGNWFLRTTWPNGSITDADGNAQQGLNPANSTYRAWRAVWSAANELTSNWDGVYLDNVFWQPRVSADYSQSGSSQSPSAAGQTWRDGYAAYVTLLKTALPGRYVIGNTADWANGPIPGYNQMLNGGVMESIIGQSYSYESQGWAQMMNAYKIIMNATAAPGYQIFPQDGSQHGLSRACAMGSPRACWITLYYFIPLANGGAYDTIPLYDELSFNLGARRSGAARTRQPRRTPMADSRSGRTVYGDATSRTASRSLIPKGNGTADRDSGNDLQAPFRNAGALGKQRSDRHDRDPERSGRRDPAAHELATGAGRAIAHRAVTFSCTAILPHGDAGVPSSSLLRNAGPGS